MGLFFERRAPSPEVVNLVATALQAQPPPAGTAPLRAETLMENFDPIKRVVTTAFDAPHQRTSTTKQQEQRKLLWTSCLVGQR